ncbi:septum site-determining protein MinC [Scopulibacillus darangshiensis]|uniref:Probable septum site-determining protein MinC n=1 Tax=Scopulibacillus darangshiensis TaxID=442528 RepID=A0A4R2PAX3_9BACL|nr:septum site-determining protein MinC [Scopulibacillus darangshiensis]TCP32240.1 septum site-determining protein MinC [Scopulibacillus darangshiensis]
MSKTQPLVTIKGTKDGLILSLNDMCSYHHLIAELREKLSVNKKHYQEGPLISVKVQGGNRYLSKEQRAEITEIIRSQKKLFVADIETNVMTKDECEEKQRKGQLTSLTQVVRSGQVLEIEGDFLLIGDVNPGAKITATGNIYVLGSLGGIAHAGVEGDHDAIIAASLMKPTQLRIGDVISRSTDDMIEYGNPEQTMACAFLDSSYKKIAIDRIQSYFKRSKQLARL